MNGAVRLRPKAGLTGTLISLVALAALVGVVYRSGWIDLIRPLATANMVWLSTAALLALSVEVAKTLRWQLLLGLEARTLPRLMATLLSGRVLNVAVPLRAGDVWRVASVSAAEDRPLPLVAGSVIAEKLLDGTALALGAILLLGSAGLRAAGPAQLLVAGTGILAAFTLALGGGRRIAARFGLAQWLASATYLRRPMVLLGTTLLTLAGIALGLLVNLSVLNALGMAADPAAATMMLLSSYAVGLVPAGPGQMGVFELGVSGALIAAGMAASPAVAAAVALHLVLLATLAAGGLLALPLNAFGRTRLRSASAISQALESLDES